MSYKALPDALHIGDSQVAGQGIFATEDIPVDTELGLSHILLEILFDEIFRTPLGGFINHSDDPNCTKWSEDDKYFVKTLRKIHKGEELFLCYTFYKV